MSQQCPYCAAPLTEQDGGAAELAMVCPQCGSELTADLVSPAPDSLPSERPDDDELLVDFSLADTEPAVAPSQEPVVDEQAIEWLDETPLADDAPMENAPADAEPMEIDFELESGESAEEFFGVEDTSAAAAATGPLDDADVSDWKLEDEDSEVAVASERGEKDSQFPEGVPMAKQPFEMMDPPTGDKQPSKKERKSILARLVGGVVLTAGLLLGAAVLQLLCWWIVRMDPLNVAFMIPKPIGFLVPYHLSKDGREAAMRVAVRQDPAAGDSSEDEEELPSGFDAQLPPDDSADLAESTDTTEDMTTEQMPAPEPAVDLTPPDDGAAADDALVSQRSNESDFVPATEPAVVPSITEPADDIGFAAAEPAMDEPGDVASPSPAGDDAVAQEGAASDDDMFGFDEPPTEAPSDAVVAAEPKPVSLITNVPVFRATDLRSAMAVAAEATRQLNEAKRNRVATAELKEIARDFYKSLCELGETGTLVETGTATGELNDARELLENLAQDASKLRMIGTSSVGWLAGRLGDGIIVSGTVESSQPVGNFQEVTLRPTGKDQTLIVVTPKELAAAGNVLMVGQNVLLAGYVVRDPSLQIPDYLSNANEVIWTNNLIVATP